MPTQKQKIAASKLVENGGNISKSMIQAGYSRNTAKTPTKLTSSKGWMMILDKTLSDKELLRVHRELLNSVKTESLNFPITLTDNQIKHIVNKIPEAKIIKIEHMNTHKLCFYLIPDPYIRKSAVELAYKIKSKYPSSYGKIDNNDLEGTLNVALDRMSKILPQAGN